MNALKIEEQCEQIKGAYTEKFLFLGIQCSFRAENSKIIAEIIIFWYEIGLINHYDLKV